MFLLLMFVVLQSLMAVRKKDPQAWSEPRIYTDKHRCYLVVGVVVLQKQMAVREKQKEPQD